MKVAWVVEQNLFENNLEECIVNSGNSIVHWDDDWRGSGIYPKLEGRPVVFYGSISNAEWITRPAFKQYANWNPGSFFNTKNFYCSEYYDKIKIWNLQQNYIITDLQYLFKHKEQILSDLNNPEHIFIRPDSPMKEFSGRIVTTNNLSLNSFDYGMYFDTDTINIVISPIAHINYEWRYIIADKKVITGSQYSIDRMGICRAVMYDAVWEFANMVGEKLDISDPVYVLDICESNGVLRIVEINPFSGSDLYNCDTQIVVSEINRISKRIFDTSNGL